MLSLWRGGTSNEKKVKKFIMIKKNLKAFIFDEEIYPFLSPPFFSFNFSHHLEWMEGTITRTKESSEIGERSQKYPEKWKRALMIKKEGRRERRRRRNNDVSSEKQHLITSTPFTSLWNYSITLNACFSSSMYAYVIKSWG